MRTVAQLACNVQLVFGMNELRNEYDLLTRIEKARLSRVADRAGLTTEIWSRPSAWAEFGREYAAALAACDDVGKSPWE
jgi:hypothetical protein